MFSIEEQKTATCETHGDYTSSLMAFGKQGHWSGCPKCSDISRAQLEKEMREAELEKYRMARMSAAAIPPRFETKTLENYQADGGLQAEVLDFCKTYASDFQRFYSAGTGIMFLGLVGTGKTHLAAGILREVINAGKSGRYITVSRIMRDIKDTFAKHSEKSEGEVLDYLIKRDLLVIDEIGVQRANEFEANTLFEVINGRYEAIRPTILIANLTLKEMRENIGDRVFDRMRENGGRAFVMDWKSNRGAK